MGRFFVNLKFGKSEIRVFGNLEMLNCLKQLKIFVE